MDTTYMLCHRFEKLDVEIKKEKKALTKINMTIKAVK